MNQAQKQLHDMFEAYKHTSEYKDRGMIEIMARREEFERNLDEMWAIYCSGNLRQSIEYRKGVDQIKSAGLTVLRNKAGKHKIVYKK